MRYLVWNCRGIFSANNFVIPFFKWMVRKFLIYVVFFLETKVQFWVMFIYINIWGFSMFYGVDVIGSKGGFVFFWVSEIEFKVLFLLFNVIFCEINDNMIFFYFVVFVYGVLDVSDREAV